jgi:hypothetical protein
MYISPVVGVSTLPMVIQYVIESPTMAGDSLATIETAVGAPVGALVVVVVGVVVATGAMYTQAT